MNRPLCIYAGYLVRYPLGGHLLGEISNIVALQRLGYDVIVVEESGGAWAPCYDAQRNEMTADPSYGIACLQHLLRPHKLERSWCYVDTNGYHGLSGGELRAACRKARFIFSRAGVTWLEEFRECNTRLYVDIDPGFTQFKMPATPVASCAGYASPYDFNYHFTIGERIGQPDCPIPTHGLHWRRTRPPIALDLAPVRFAPDAQRFTTVMSWTAYGSVEYRGVTYGQKNVEFLKLIELPRHAGPVFELALGGPDAPYDTLHEDGWHISGALEATRTTADYLNYIGNSRGEFSVAKEGYVKTRCGWFSDRTAAYLASGKPAIVQDTGFSESLPCGEGLFAFKNVADIVDAIEKIGKDYQRHCAAARRIAEEYFDSEKILRARLQACDLPVATTRASRTSSGRSI
ncbi:MAG TPA: hypothetical protein VL486_13855 [Verrucomicrobiae bacterium]|nr:hypothetical protein [Verrucomicrobiae bacterium]